MNWKETELSYRRAEIKDATAVRLVIIMYDMLVADLQRAIEAIHASDVEKRSAEIKHAFLVLQQLEGSLEMEKGGESAKNLSFFYSVMRSKILEAHIKISVPMLQKQVEHILDVRSAWEQVDPGKASAAAAGASSGATYASADPEVTTHVVTNVADESPRSGSWSA
ncbi:MAG TPA: flagellar export chaperone FliS [Terriglobales bacterium]|jgi:flagellar protein FliS